MANEPAPCFQQELEAFTTNIPLYEWPYYTAEKDLFGSSMAISGDTLAVGTPWAARIGFTYEPAVYIYVRAAGQWRLQQKIITPLGWTPGWSQSSFGFSIALEGNTLVIGDPAKQTTWIYERVGNAWSIAAYLPASQFLPGSDAFGHTVGISGDRIIVGDSSAHAYIDPTYPGPSQYFYPGSVSVFKRVNGVWTLEQEFSPGVPMNALVFYPIAISGDTIAVFRGRVHIYRRGPGGWSEVQQLEINIDDIDDPYAGPHAISMNEDHIVVGTGKSVHIFQNVNGTWSPQARIPAGNDSNFQGLWYFGLSVAIYEQLMIVSDLNSAHIYELAAGGWTERQELDLGPFFFGPLGGYSPVMVAVGNDAFVASNNFPPVFYGDLMVFGDFTYYDRAPSAREVDYFSSQDVLPPFISTVSVSTTELWPPDHQMVEVTLSYQTSDNCGAAATEVTVTSNEPETGTGAGDTSPDWEVMDDHHVRLRAERAGLGDGRIYTIRVTARDASGNSSSQSTSVSVPHER